MTVHLIKLCVGVREVGDLIAWQTARRADMAARGAHPEIVHVTRMTPRRRDDILNGGSLYWVIKGFIQARQSIVDLRAVNSDDGVRRCGIVLAPDLVLCAPSPRRPFQGWRYLAQTDAPRDLTGGVQASLNDMPEEMRAELMELGLI